MTESRFVQLIAAGALDGAAELGLHGPIGDAGAEALAACPGLDALRRLELVSSGLTAAGLAAVVGAFGGHLERLELTGSPVRDAGAKVVAGAAFPRLTALALDSAGLTDAGAAALAGAAGLGAVTRLSLANNRLTPAGVAGLLAAAGLRKVCDWDLHGNAVPVTDWFPLAVGAAARADLTVRFPAATVTVARTGAGRRARLAVTVVGDREPAPHLFDRWAAARLDGCVAALAVADVRFDADAVNRLADALARRPVRSLALTRTHLRNEAAAALAARLPDLGLEVLDLDGNEIGKAGAEALAASPGLGTVRTLVLSGNPVRPTGAAAVAGSRFLARARRLVLPGADLDPDRRKDLRGLARPGADVVFA